MKFTIDDPYLNDIRAISKDHDGNDVLIGLTFLETIEYLTLLEKENLTDKESDRFIEMSDRHRGAHSGRILWNKMKETRDVKKI